MPYVDLQSREREERTRDPRERTGLWHALQNNPSILIAAGFALGVAASGIALIFASGGYTSLVLIVALIFVVLVGASVWRLAQDKPGESASKLGGEKQLLMAIRRTGGSITPVEAALETSLTVDEADEILFRFASKGHLRVESLDGSLCYSLPERRGVDDSG